MLGEMTLVDGSSTSCSQIMMMPLLGTSATLAAIRPALGTSKTRYTGMNILRPEKGQKLLV
jgi:hypothetical protein